MPQRTIRFSEATINRIRQAATKKGCTSTEVVRQAVEQVLTDAEEAEGRITTTVEQIRNDLSRMHRVQQTMLAFVERQAIADRFTRPVVCVGCRGKERL